MVIGYISAVKVRLRVFVTRDAGKAFHRDLLVIIRDKLTMLRLRAALHRRRHGASALVSRLSTTTRGASVADNAPGLFQLPSLHAPEDFYRLTEDAKRKCHALRQDVSLLGLTPTCKLCGEAT